MKKILIALCAALFLIPSCNKDQQDEKEQKKKYSIEDVQAVDLGLSVLWADRNIGAESPEDPGHFFSWGETTPRKYGTFASPYIFENTDAPVKLTGEYDTATTLWGDGWRMPTMEELRDLINLSHKETKDGDGNTTGTTISGNGHSIYIPIAEPKNAYKSYGLWSSERSEDPLWAKYFDNHGNGISHSRREYAHAIRPVKDK